MRTMSTDQGFNALAVLIPAIEIIRTMDGGWERTLLLALSIISVSVVGYMTKGDKPSQSDEHIDEHADVSEILKRGRD